MILLKEVKTMNELVHESIHEILEKVAKESSVKEKVKILQSYDSPPIRAVLRGAYDPTIKWLIPNSKPPFTPNEAEDWDLAPLQLSKEIMQQINRYVARLRPHDGRWDNGIAMRSQTHREQLFIEFIEGLHPTEADVVFGMINRKLPYKGLTSKLVNDAFPGMIPDGTLV
jgi:hypothetical protein